MADRKQFEASKIDALYSWISYDLQKMKGELLNEMKYSSVQVGSLYKEMKSDKEKSSQAISQEIRYSYKQNQTIYDGLAAMLTREVGERLNSMDEKISSLEEMQALITQTVAKLDTMDLSTVTESVKEEVSEVVPQLSEAVNEVKYSYMQHQAIYDGLSALISGDVVSKLGDVEMKLELLEKIDSALEEIQQAVAESVFEKTEESVALHSNQILEAVAAIPVAENVDYTRIVDEVGDKVIELLGEVVSQEQAPAAPVDAKIDYERIIYGSAEKVVESLPYPEKVDYRRINDSFQTAAEKIQPTVSEDVIAAAVSIAVEKALAALDIDAIASAVAQKIEIPVVEPETIDYDRLATMVAEKITAGNSQIAEVVMDEDGVDKIADKIVEKLGNDDEEEVTYNLVLDEDGIQAIAKGVSEELCKACANCEEPVEEIVEETTEEVVEEIVEEPATEETVEEVVEETTEEAVEEVTEEVVEETTEETVEEVVQETSEETVEEVVEEVVEEAVQETAADEIAVAAEPVYQELGDDLVDAETGLVIRLKRSFTAKMKQSEDKVKGYYSDIKNELTSYKRINSNVSWHGDRFNFGRDTVAKVNICGKTLCFYLALDPEDPEYKTTIYHQKNVGHQRAYESTPFMVKIKSDAAAKKALRLVGYLAEKLGTDKEESFEAVDYVEEFKYASTKELFDEGFIKVTKEKKVDLDF